MKKDHDYKKYAKEIINEGCAACFNSSNGKHGMCVITECPFLPERDLKDGRITEKEYIEWRKLHDFEEIIVS
jgi:hypothetical protein